MAAFCYRGLIAVGVKFSNYMCLQNIREPPLNGSRRSDASVEPGTTASFVFRACCKIKSSIDLMGLIQVPQ